MRSATALRRPALRARRTLAGLGALLAVLVAAQPALAAPMLDVTPSSGVVGASVSATATGFPEGAVTFRWDNGQLLGTVTAGPSGSAVLDFAIPATATAGTHYVRACASNKCPQGAIYADATVTVVPPPTPSPTPVPTPVPTAPPTPVPTPSPTPVPTPVPTAPPTPTPTLRPGQTPNPTPATTSQVPGSPQGSPDSSPTADASPAGSPSSSASFGLLAGVETPPGTTTVSAADASTGTEPAAGPTADSSLPGGAVPIVIGAIGVIVLAGALLAMRRRRPVRAAGGGGARSPSPNALPTTWDVPDPALDPDPAPDPTPTSAPTAPALPREATEPRQRTIVVTVRPEEPPRP